MSELLRDHCVACHDAYTTEGEFDLTELLEDKMQPEARARLLAKIQQRVVADEMPPEDSDTMTLHDRKTLNLQIDAHLDRLARRLRDDPGDVAMTRLTPYEFRNVLRDLSGGVVTNAGRYLPNEGGAGEGFANVGAAQVMTLAQYEKYIEAAKRGLRHLRVYPNAVEFGIPANETDGPASMNDVVWLPYPREPVDEPQQARKELTDEIIAWYVGQQQKWGEEHREDLEQRLGFVHAAYLEAAWRYRYRGDRERELDEFAWINKEPGCRQSQRIQLAPAALAKWWKILNSEDERSPHAAWAAAWRQMSDELTPDGGLLDALSAVDRCRLLSEVRRDCLDIVTGQSGDGSVEPEDYAPPYEISYHEAKDEVLEAAEKEKRWPFRIDIGGAEELFLVVTDAGDGGRGEYAVWQDGRFLFRDGSAKPWQELVTIIGAGSGREYPFGFDGEKSKVLEEHAVGAKPPGALKFTVPDQAIVFEVDLAIDTNRTKEASIQALVLKEKPKSSSYVPGRYVFGGKKRPLNAGAELKKEQQRALRKRNVAEANRTKIGLNAERNVLASWDRTSIEAIGGPWPEQDADQYEPEMPYHYTVPEVLRNATQPDLQRLRLLEDRLASIAGKTAESELLARATPIVHSLATRAWRRPVTKTELESLLRLYTQSRKTGFSFDSAVKSSLLGVLSSPHFLYRSLDRETRGSRKISHYSIASRLSFFLWGSLPDPELLQLASEHKLHDAEILKQQVRRMLRDKRASSLAIDFAGQLWGFSDFAEFSNPDKERFDAFTPELRQGMLDEVRQFVADVIRNDRPLTHLLNADYTFASNVLAEHYGLDETSVVTTQDNPDALAERPATSVKRSLEQAPGRGGLVTMALFLTKTSLPLRTSPVQRGVWVMEKLLGRELPNPPASVPSLSEDEEDAEGLSILEQLERHRADASCAACHDKIDPLGISLQEYDPIGRKREGEQLVTVARTHDGVELTGASGLKRYLLDHRDEFFQNFNRKLLGYALGRAVHVGDRALLTRMKQRLSGEHYRFSSLVEEIVTSRQFLTKRDDAD